MTSRSAGNFIELAQQPVPETQFRDQVSQPNSQRLPGPTINSHTDIRSLYAIPSCADETIPIVLMFAGFVGTGLKGLCLFGETCIVWMYRWETWVEVWGDLFVDTCEGSVELLFWLCHGSMRNSRLADLSKSWLRRRSKSPKIIASNFKQLLQSGGQQVL